jgi:L,D-transpeptidase ErfK/SrfK
MRQMKHFKAENLSFCSVLLWVLLATLAAADDEKPTLSAQIVGGDFEYIVQRGDSLTGIGARYGVPVGALAGANGLASNARLKENQKLRIDNRHIVPATLDNGILINIPQRMLFYFKGSHLSLHFPVGLGRPDWPTPTGNFTVLTKEEDPIWDVPKSIQEEMRRQGKPVLTCVPPGPNNPLGKHWMGLSRPGYGIHGTIAPWSIYQFRTHGCVRLHADDVAQLFAAVSRGTAGRFIYSRLMVARSENQIFLEVHPDVYGKEPELVKQLAELVRRHNLATEVDWERAMNIIRRERGIATLATKGATNSR